MRTDLRGFWSLILTQFQGAFSDSALKRLTVFIGLGMALAQPQRDRLVPLVEALFALPFLLFSMAGGFLADRFSKRSVVIGVKVFEIAIMAVVAAGLAANHLAVMLAGVFMMGVHSALFGPSKYGILPELLPEKRLSWGNGVLEMGTFAAIISGTVAGAWMSERFVGQQAVSGGILLALAAVGLVAATRITRVPSANPTAAFRWNPLSDLLTQLSEIRRDRVLLLAVFGNTWFFFFAALVNLNVVLYATETLGAGPTHSGLLIAATGVGIGLGSLAAGYLSGNKIEYGLIPLGALGLTLFSWLLAWPGLSLREAAALLALLGFSGGFFMVPIAALLQHRPAAGHKGAIIAAANLLSFAGVFLAAGVYYFLKSLNGLTPLTIFEICGELNIAATAYALWLLPDSMLRLLLWMLTHSFYRVRVDGRDNIPEKGGALFVCNHMSFVDALLLIASTDRFIRFVMFKDIYERPYIKPFARMLRAIPISAQQRPREMIRSLREASEAIRSGDVVCIFAEGQITRIGQLLPFRRGFERVMKNVDAPIIPVHLDGVWGSIFSFERGRFFWKLPRHFPYPVTVCYGRPMPATSTAFEVRQAVQELSSAAFTHRRRRMQTLHRAFIRSARTHPRRVAMADGTAPHLRFLPALARSIYLARRLREVWRGQDPGSPAHVGFACAGVEEMVGILLPPSVGGALVNFAAMLCGKVPVNLNYTVSAETLESCARQCRLETVVTSKAFLERVKLTVPGRTVLIEEIAGSPRVIERVIALVMASVAPAWLIERLLSGRHASLDDLATVIFSSGSTGEPKGVMLTHFNVGANVEQLGQTFFLGRDDRILGILPFFHSFGFTGTLCLPAALGIGVVFHPNPLDARAIGALVRQHAVTFLLSTPTFLQAYQRRCMPEDFGSVQYVLVGAEKLPERVALAFEDTFGLRPLEAYGATECAPAVTVNTRDFRAPGFRQVGGKRGRIGHPLPGISVRVIDPETGAPLPPGAAGLLLVRGPNVMKGYLGKAEKTAEVLRDGWYVTGDIAALDEDGFLTITDRLSRFSKIGGEMVPHIKVEEKLHELAGITEQSFAVTGIPDEKKGERLAVLHTVGPEPLADCIAKLAQSDLPNLWRPRENCFYRVEALPYLGTGKVDLRRVREMATQFASRAAAAGNG